MARDWARRFADAGAVGHINAESDLGDWPLGERLLNRLLEEHASADQQSEAQWFRDVALGTETERELLRRRAAMTNAPQGLVRQ